MKNTFFLTQDLGCRWHGVSLGGCARQRGREGMEWQRDAGGEMMMLLGLYLPHTFVRSRVPFKQRLS